MCQPRVSVESTAAPCHESDRVDAEKSDDVGPSDARHPATTHRHRLRSKHLVRGISGRQDRSVLSEDTDILGAAIVRLEIWTYRDDENAFCRWPIGSGHRESDRMSFHPYRTHREQFSLDSQGPMSFGSAV